MQKVISLSLKGLDCANCAAKIEDALQRKGLNDAAVSFATGQILLPEDQADLAQQVIDTVEKGVTIVRPQPATTNQSKKHGADGHHHAHGSEGHAHEEHEYDHDHGHEHSHGSDEVGRGRLVELVLAGVLFLVGFLFNERLHNTPYAIGEYATLLTAYALVGRRVLAAAVRNGLRGQFFDENFLMTIATLGAFAIHQVPEAVAVMLFYSVGEYVQDLAVSRSRRSIRALMEVRPDYANVRRNGEVQRVTPDSVTVGEEIMVRPGERIPLDGEIVEGSTFVDTSALTGESVPRQVTVGSSVLAGSVNTRGVITVRVTRVFGESSISKIMQLVEQAASRKAPTERLITAFSRYYTPAVVLIALALAVIPPLVVPDATFGEWLRRALVLLVISCPCALVVSIPLGYFGGIGGASRQGVLIKGGNYLDALAKVDTVVWDKTGTLTQGVFRVTEVETFNGFSRDQVLELAAHVEVHSSHPIATSIQEAHGRPVEASAVSDYEEIAGHGVKAKIGETRVLAGNARLLRREGVSFDELTLKVGTTVFVAAEGKLAGRIVISDEVKAEAVTAIRTLRELGVGRQVMLTGDERSVAEHVGQALGLDEVRANLLPENKVGEIERIDQERANRKKGTLAFVGDGINDAPVLTRADVGMAMGGLGSDAAIEAADVVIMDDNPAKIATAVRLARKTRLIVYQNIGFALAIKILVMALGAGGAASLWEAVFADVGVSLLAILNASRVLRLGKTGSPIAVSE